jgi:hypothetical protein
LADLRANGTLFGLLAVGAGRDLAMCSKRYSERQDMTLGSHPENSAEAGVAGLRTVFLDFGLLDG